MDAARPALIFECANAHGGDVAILKQTIATFAGVDYPHRHIKFQVLHPDRIALPDFSAYNLYRQLHFEPSQWTDILQLAGRSFDVLWLDIFDTYGVEILSAHLADIGGVKLQASVLENAEVLDALGDLALDETKIVMNVSGIELTDIGRIIDSISGLGPAEVVLQLGFQDYPTRIEHTGLNKIAVLRAAFPDFPLCLADHTPAEDDQSRIVPLLGVLAGCGLIEKHICLDRAHALYDYQSALHADEMQVLADRLSAFPAIASGPFISVPEKHYLDSTIQVAVAARDLPAGSLVGRADVMFRRTAQAGDRLADLRDRQHSPSVLSEPVQAGRTIRLADLREARVGVIVACRMKSSRLKDKALAPLAGRPSVERCLENCLRVPGADEVVLATSTVDEDAVLENHTLDGRVRFWRGDPQDVIKRYLGACAAFGIDVVVRVTADCPFVAPEIVSHLLERHFTTGADYTAARDCAVGTGVEIINAEALRRVIDLKGGAEHSEYMTWYFRNNPDVFKLTIVDLPPEWVRDYRLTLDYQEDLDLLDTLYRRFAGNGETLSLERLFAILDEEPELANLNSHITLRYKTDTDLIARLDAETRIGGPTAD